MPFFILFGTLQQNYDPMQFISKDFNIIAKSPSEPLIANEEIAPILKKMISPDIVAQTIVKSLDNDNMYILAIIPTERLFFLLKLKKKETDYEQFYIEYLNKYLDAYHNLTPQNQLVLFKKIVKTIFLEQNTKKKLIILGQPSSGKTCIKMAFFDGEDPEKLLGPQSPEPTRGIINFIHQWVDLEIGIFDSAGQSMNIYLNEEENFEQIMIFDSTDIIIYIFDISSWQKNTSLIYNDLTQITKLRNKFCPNAKIYPFCHKIDLLDENSSESKYILTIKNNSAFFLSIKKEIETKSHTSTIFTSIRPTLIHTLFRSMQMILNDLSTNGYQIEHTIQNFLKRNQKKAILLLYPNQNAISFFASTDFECEKNAILFEKFKKLYESLSAVFYFNKTTVQKTRIDNNLEIIVKLVNFLFYKTSVIGIIGENVNESMINEIFGQWDLL